MILVPVVPVGTGLCSTDSNVKHLGVLDAGQQRAQQGQGRQEGACTAGLCRGLPVQVAKRHVRVIFVPDGPLPRLSGNC